MKAINHWPENIPCLSQQKHFNMKHFFTPLFLLLLLSNTGNAQNGFADSSAVWHYEMGYGSFHCYATGYDTVQGIRATTIKREALVKQPWFSHGLRVYDLRDLKIYETPDTVFVFNSIFNRFTPLYVFNAGEGDTVCLPVLLSGGMMDPSTDSTFCFIIDSIRIRQYDTAWLRTFYTRSLNENDDGYILNWGRDTLGAYAERIGGLYTGLLPACLNCIQLLSDNYQSEGPIRCYTDRDYTIRLVSGPCDNDGISKSVASLQSGDHRVTIAPVPAHDHIRVITDNPEEVLQVIVSDMQGRTLMITDQPGTTLLSAHDLPDGIYIVRVRMKEGNHVQQIVVQHRF